MEYDVDPAIALVSAASDFLAGRHAGRIGDDQAYAPHDTWQAEP